MIKATYEIKLNGNQFEALKRMVERDYQKGECCTPEDSELYTMFNLRLSIPQKIDTFRGEKSEGGF